MTRQNWLDFFCQGTCVEVLGKGVAKGWDQRVQLLQQLAPAPPLPPALPVSYGYDARFRCSEILFVPSIVLNMLKYRAEYATTNKANKST